MAVSKKPVHLASAMRPSSGLDELKSAIDISRNLSCPLYCSDQRLRLATNEQWLTQKIPDTDDNPCNTLMSYTLRRCADRSTNVNELRRDSPGQTSRHIVRAKG